MAVYKRSYKPYEGRSHGGLVAISVPSRYALETLFQSRLLIGFMVASWIVPIFARDRDLPASQSERDHVAAYQS